MKILENKIKKDYDEKRVKMYEEFEILKSQFSEQFSQQTNEYQNLANQDLQKQKEEFEKQKEQYEIKYEEKVQRKTQLLEGIFAKRQAELEDEFSLKKQKLEFDIKNIAESQDSKYKADIEKMIAKFETQSQEKVKRIESETQDQIQEYLEKINQKDEEMKKLKSEHEKKLKDQKKVIDREIKFKSETLEKESIMKMNREVKKHKEVVEDYEAKLKEFDEKLDNEKKRHKDMIKANNDKHKAEIKNIKNNNENELVRKKIEHNKEFKKIQRELEIEIENLKKERDVEILERLNKQKKELASVHSQKLKLEKSKHEEALLAKETELNNTFQDREIELHKQHEQEFIQLRDTLTKQHDKLMSSVIENTKAEVKEQYRKELDDEINCATERIKNKYQTENESLKMKLQELHEVQSNATHNEARMISTDLIKKEDESLQTEEIYLGNEYKRNDKGFAKNQPFDYEHQMAVKIEVGAQNESEQAQVSVRSSRNNETIQYIKQPMSNADMMIRELVEDPNVDQSSAESVEYIKNKLNEILLKYKKKIDAKALKTKNKLQREYMLEKKKLQDEYELMRQYIQKDVNDSPSMLDTGEENGISPDKLIRKTKPRSFTDFTKEFRICDKQTYEKNIITKVAPIHDGKSIIVDLDRVVNDLNMIKSSFSASAKQLGFDIVEPHKLEQENLQEQVDPNIPEPVYNTSQQYRHLLNTFLRFSRDLILHSNGDASINYYKQANDDIYKQKQEIMSYQLQITDLKDQIIKAKKELKMLQNIYQNHVESRLQIVDFSVYNTLEMSEHTRIVIDHIKQLYNEIMDYQTVFLQSGDNIKQVNDECLHLSRKIEHSDDTQILYQEISNIERKSDTLQHNLHNDEKRMNEFGIRRSHEVIQNNSYTAQIPRPSFIGGSNTTRSNFVSPRESKNIHEYANRGSTESTKNPYNYNTIDHSQSFTKPPKSRKEQKHDSRVRCMQERYKINRPNKSLERNNSFDCPDIRQSRNKAGLASTQSLKNLSKFIENTSFRDQDDIELSKAQESINI